jgi:xylitol oxidase
MDKRQFLKASGIVIADSMLSRFASPQPAAAHHRTNWAGNLEYSTDNLVQPASVDEVRLAVKSAGKLRALGARHSFNAIADSTVEQISLEKLEDMHLDEQARTVTVGAGVRYGKLAPYIDARGFAVHNLASLPHVTVAGACATATHGSGLHNGNLATVVSAIEMVTPSGDLVTISRAKDGDRFLGSVVALGSLGVITRITLDVIPTFQMTQVVYQDLSFSQLEHHFDDIFGAGYSVSLFTDWQNHRATQVWLKRKVEPGSKPDEGPTFYGAKRATHKLHPIGDHSAEPCTEQMGIPGPWYERLPHFKMNFTPSSGAELQTEYFVPRERGYEAILAVEKLKDRITPHLFVTELRTIARDELWMSMAYQRDSLAIHFTWKPEWPAVKELLPAIEEQLKPFETRPHWAKLFTVPPATLAARYPRMGDFRKLAQQYDPHGKLRNAFVDKNVFAT